MRWSTSASFGLQESVPASEGCSPDPLEKSSTSEQFHASEAFPDGSERRVCKQEREIGGLDGRM